MHDLLTLRLETAADRHEGHLFTNGSDGFVLAFATAEAAIGAADEIAKGPRPAVRVGVHHGPIVLSADGELTAGSTISEATAIQRAAGSGVVLVSDAVKRAVKDNETSRRLTKDSTAIRVGVGGSVQARELTEPVDPVEEAKATRRNLMYGAGGFVAVAAVVWLFFGHTIMTYVHPKHDHVAVQAFRVAAGGAAADFSTDVTDEIDYVLGQGQIPTVSRADAESLREGDNSSKLRALEVGAVLDGTVEGDANTLDIKLHIDDPVHKKRIWEHEFTGPVGDDFKEQVASRVVQILTCSAKALKAGSDVTDPEILTLYVKFCDTNADAATNTSLQASEETILRQLVAKAPDFSYGHSELALFLASKAQVDPANAKALMDESSREADRAATLDPKNSEALVAQTQLLTPPSWPQREQRLSLASAVPLAGDAPRVRYAQMLAEVGRVREASAQALKAATVSPWDADIVGYNGLSLATIGKYDDADVALTRALQTSATDTNVQAWQFHMYEWVGRWDDALNMLNDPKTLSPIIAQEDDAVATRAFITAMLRGDEGSKSAARDAELASAQHDRSHLMTAISHLAALGYVDDAFALTDRTPPAANTDDLSVLFQPLADALRRDPRFMALAGRLGLTAYWTSSNKWPDFCTTAGLPYECRAEAQKTAKS